MIPQKRTAYPQILLASPRLSRVALYGLLPYLLCGMIFAPAVMKTAISAIDPDAGWPMFRGSQNLSGVSTADLPKVPKLRWTFQAKDSIESSAAIAGNIAYVGSMDASLSAVDLNTGKLRWRYATAGPIQESSPCVRNGLVFVGDLNGIFHAVDALTGKARWTFKAEGEIKSSPNYLGNRIYFGSYDQNLYCIAADTGTLMWKYTTEGPVHCTPAIDKGRVYISGCDETFRAIDALSGKQVFSVQLGAYTGASAAIQGNHAYVGTFGNEVLCLNIQQRAVQWVYRNPARSFPYYSSAGVTDAQVVLGGRDKLVHCLDRLSGKELWTFTTKARVESSPLVAGNRVFVGSNDGFLYELDLATGKKNWEFAGGAPMSASPAAAQGYIVVGNQDGALYCFGD
jgi:eukaryotic-like serine/threonine-protein kinase